MKKVNILLMAMGCMGVSLMTGCSSSPETKAEIVKAQIEADEVKAERQSELNGQAQDKAEDFLSSAPDWFIEPLKPDEKGIYAAALGVSSDVTTAIRKAELQAKYGVSAKVKDILSAEETMTGSLDVNYRYIINSFVNSVDVSSAEPVSRVIKAIDGKYNVFVMVRYPYSSIHSDMIKANSARSNAEIDTAYKRLMKRIQESKDDELKLESAEIKPVDVVS